MSNRLDQLFKNKLSDHVVTPPAQAWERVGAKLGKKNDRAFLLRIAASILLAGAVAALVIRLASKESMNPETIGQHQQPKASAPAAIPTPTTTDNTKTTPVVTKNKKSTAIRKRKDISPELEKEKEMTPVAEVVSKEELTVAVQSLPVTTAPTKEKPNEEKPIVLEYRLTPVSSGPVVASSASPEGKTKSSLSKVLDFALEAKNGESHLGDLRQAKDELFAFDFKKEKQNSKK